MFGDRLNTARKMAGHSLRSLSRSLGGRPTAQAIGKYERGEMMPSPENLIEISRVLRVSADFLFNGRELDLEAVDFRSDSEISARDRTRIAAAAAVGFQRRLWIEDILEISADTWRGLKLGGRFLVREDDAENCADDLRSDWQTGTGPIADMTALLEDRGILVIAAPLSDNVRVMSCLVRGERLRSDHLAIIANGRLGLEARRFALASELAHRIIDISSPVDTAAAARLFALAFLMPRKHLVRQAGKRRGALAHRELMLLKRMFRVGAADLLDRLLQTGIIDEAVHAYTFQTLARGWRKAEPCPIEEPGTENLHELPRRFERLCFRALAEKLIKPELTHDMLELPLEDIEASIKGPLSSRRRNSRR